MDIDFRGGITCIVGPNGCGKSNVCDAVRWVLGEQSSKSLRGTQMSDVIFKGTQDRNPLGYCEVSLHFDNSNHTFAADYNDLVVTRKLFRSGESEYYINGATARLKDIAHLMHDSGVDRDGLTIIGQGQVAEIVTSRPESRRGIFEEAAGISKFKQTRVDAGRKLERVAVDLARVKDVYGEIERNLGPLMKQAKNAQQYLLLRDKLKTLEIGAYVTGYDNAAAEKNKIRAEIDAINAGIEDKRAVLATATREVMAAGEKIAAFDAEAEELRQMVLNLSVGAEREQNNKRFQLFEEINTLKQERAATLSRKRTIENFIESGEGYKFAVRKLVGGNYQEVVGVVAQELSVPNHLEAAIEVALGAAAQNIITYDEDGAKHLIEKLRHENWGRATFLPISSAKVKTLTHEEHRYIYGRGYVLGVASDLVGYDPLIRPVVETLLGRTVVVDNLENAITLAKELRYSVKLVTLDGDVIETRGSITGGSKNALNNNLFNTNTLNQLGAAITALDARIADLESRALDRTAEHVNENAGKLSVVRSLLEKISASKENLRHGIAQIEAAKIKISDEVTAATHATFRHEAAMQKIDITIEQMQMRIEEEYGMNYSACFNYMREFAIAAPEYDKLDETVREINTYKRQIAALGPVNIDAIAQCAEAQARYDDYTAQVADLEKAKADLEKVIHDLSHEMRSKFRDSFEAINKNFEVVFKELFGGGHARLEPVKDENGKIDWLECGIDIIAEPPGKKLSNLTLLSGGEKTLTAIAILFAILKFKPMPFCILDEIEAALDEVNVGRFASYLQNFSHTTQFIVITHRKPTMELANHLYGVTMQERGVSKLVSVQLESAIDDQIAIDLPAGDAIHA